MFGKIRRWIYSITHPLRKGKYQASINNGYYSKELLENAEQYMTCEDYCVDKLPKTNGNFIQWTKMDGEPIQKIEFSKYGDYVELSDFLKKKEG